MSLIRDPAIITKVGRQMMTAGGDITYTKATLYGQEISHLTKDQLESLTSIGNPLMTVPVGISDKSDNGNGTTIVLEATFQNTNLKTDLPYTAVGFFAKKGEDEKLVLVGVANAGAYLAATRPDGVATDALDLKVAIAIGDATNVTAVVDPAGSVTPATLNGAINKATHDLTAEIDTKADKTTVESELAIKANSTDVDKKLDTKANSSDVSALQSKVNVDGPLFKHLTQFNNWGDLFDGYSVNGVTATNGNRLVAFRDDTNSPNLVGGNSSGIGFGGGDTKSYLSVSYGQHRAIIGGGNGNAPVWHEEVAWKSDINSLLNTINQQNQTIQSLTTRLTNAENEINYIKANYVEGRRFPASQEAQANSWENENPQRIAFIER